MKYESCACEKEEPFMTKLECDVKTCLHNADNCCCKGAILVEGGQAKHAGETCCASFDENRGNAFKNLFKTPETSLEVSCEAVSCVYNEDCRCQADKISIGGGKACQCEQTECASFRAR